MVEQSNRYMQTYIVELHYIRVPDFLQDCDLSVYSFQVSMVLNLLLLQDFYRNLKARTVR